MASYVVLSPPEGDPEGTRTVFIRDGFAVLAFILPAFWFLWHRLWLWAILFIAITLLSGYMRGLEGLSTIGLAVSVCASFLAGLEGQQLRIRRLERLGWTARDVVEAEDPSMAEAIYFAERAVPARPEPDLKRPAAPPSVTYIAAPPAGTFGIFEWNGGR